MSNSHESLGGEEKFEGSEEILTVEEHCLSDLYGLSAVDEVGRLQPCSELFVALNNRAAPQGLHTSFRTHLMDVSSFRSPQVIPEGADVVATVTISFSSKADDHERLHNVDFVRTEQGLKVMKKNWFMIDGERLPQYVHEFSEAQVAALSADAVKIAQLVVETETEKLKLGPLAEAANEDGIRRFHVGDILSVVTGLLVSPRGMEGIYDILGYMTNDSPYTTQLGRFAEECKPSLRQQLDAVLAPFYDPPEEAMASNINCYKWLGEIGRTLENGPFLVVKPIAENDHVVMDSLTELVLDHGDDFVAEKIVSVDLEDPDED